MKKAKFISSNNESIIIEGKDIKSIYYHDVLYLEYCNPYVSIITNSGIKTYVYTSLSAIGKVLSSIFLMCNKSTIVNLSHVVFIGQKEDDLILRLSTGKIFHISRRKYKQVKELFLSIKRDYNTESNTNSDRSTYF